MLTLRAIVISYEVVAILLIGMIWVNWPEMFDTVYLVVATFEAKWRVGFFGALILATIPFGSKILLLGNAKQNEVVGWKDYRRLRATVIAAILIEVIGGVLMFVADLFGKNGPTGLAGALAMGGVAIGVLAFLSVVFAHFEVAGIIEGER